MSTMKPGFEYLVWFAGPVFSSLTNLTGPITLTLSVALSIGSHSVAQTFTSGTSEIQRVQPTGGVSEQDPQDTPTPANANPTSTPESTDVDEPEIGASPDQRVSREEIASLTAQLATKENLDGPQRETIERMLQAATAQVDSFDNFQVQIDEFEKQIARIPTSLQRLQDRQGETLQTPEEWIGQKRKESIGLDELRELIRNTESELEKLNKTLLTRRTEAERRPARLTEIPTRIGELEGRNSQLEQRLKTPPLPDEIAEVVEARSAQLRAELMSSRKEIEYLKKEQERYRAGRELLPLQIEFTQKDIQRTSRILALLKELFEERQAAQFRVVREQSIRRIESTWPLLRPMVEHDLYDIAQIEQSSEQTRKASLKIDETVSLRRSYETQYKNIQERFRTIGGSNALGTVLRSSKKEIDELRSSISADQVQDEGRRLSAEERDVLLQNELQLFEDQIYAATRLKENALKAVAASISPNGGEIERILIEDNHEMVRILFGMPVAGIQHEDALAVMTRLISGSIAELKPVIGAKIAELREKGRSPAGLDLRSEEVQDLAVRVFLFQSRIGELEVDERSWLQNIGEPALIQMGEQAFIEQAKQRIGERTRMIQQQLSAVEDENVQWANLDLERQATLSLLNEYLAWIDERVIWIRSAAWPQWKDLLKTKQATLWLLSPTNWWSIGKDLERMVSDGGYLSYLLGYVIVLIMLIFRVRLKRMLKQAGELAVKRHCMRIAPTLEGLLITVLLAAAWPLAFYVTGRVLIGAGAVNSFTWSLGQSLLGVAYLMASLELLRIFCSEYGLAGAHFGWPEKTRKFLRRKVRGFYFWAIPLLLIQGVLLAQPSEDYRNSLGRLASCLIFVAVTVYLHWIFRPRGVVFQQMAINNQLNVIYSLRSIIHLVAVTLPLGLLMLAIAGYYYTAYQLGASLEKSLSFVVALLGIGGFLFRWLLINRRCQAMEEARRIRQELEANPQRAEAIAEGALTPTEQLMEELVTVSRQSREVIVSLLWIATFVALYWIWRDMLPAVGILNHYSLWSVTNGSEVKHVTMMSIFNAGLAMLITWVLIRNMPGLLNMAVQTYSTLDSGARYAATTLFRYVITIIGGVVALSFLQIQWAQYGWLVAAVSVGLGFGLQEIVANFVSGLILLFERPVRIGDTITIDNQNGMVTRIQMRATTIRTWDYQELIIPNKDLMTGKLLNWTLSNSTNRLTLTVGVAYGTDPDRVRDILYAIVLAHPEVLKDPVPAIGMEDFGESSLKFVVRCLLSSMESRVRIRHELNAAIARAFTKENIEIPFPQLDLHMIQQAESAS